MHPVLLTVLQRLGLGLATLFAVSIIIFISIEMLPGDFGQVVLGQAATEDTVAAFRKELGLDKPSYVRYFDWIAGVAQGDLGTSFSGRAASGQDRSREVVDLIAPRLQNTLFLAGITALVSVPLALILGISTALYRNSIYDRSINTVTLTTISFPEFFVSQQPHGTGFLSKRLPREDTTQPLKRKERFSLEPDSISADLALENNVSFGLILKRTASYVFF